MVLVIPRGHSCTGVVWLLLSLSPEEPPFWTRFPSRRLHAAPVQRLLWQETATRTSANAPTLASSSAGGCSRC